MFLPSMSCTLRTCHQWSDARMPCHTIVVTRRLVYYEVTTLQAQHDLDRCKPCEGACIALMNLPHLSLEIIESGSCGHCDESAARCREAPVALGCRTQQVRCSA
jgi:hypothetical protein